MSASRRLQIFEVQAAVITRANVSKNTTQAALPFETMQLMRARPFHPRSVPPAVVAEFKALNADGE